jgi:hypothetical protein
MLPAYLLRAGIDWVRHNAEFANSNPYARCEQSVKICEKLWDESFGLSESSLLEVAVVTAYWEEFFHAEDPLQDEKEWRDGLSKRSGQYENFEKWQDWFKSSYAKVYTDNNIWTSLLMTAWASTHQYQLSYTDDSWDFKPSRSYLPTSHIWRLKPHVDTLINVLKEFWIEESARWDEVGFTIEEESFAYLGRVECLGFDLKRYHLSWPAKAHLAPEVLDLGAMVADLIAPVGDAWYRRPDSVIFAHDHLDVTALLNRASYVFGSRRRLYELAAEDGMTKARTQAQAEGWMVEDLDELEETEAVQA